MSNKPGFMKPQGTRGMSRQQAQPQGMQIKVDDLPQVKCMCGGIDFAQSMQLRFASKLVSPNGQQTVVQVPGGWVCTKCGEINDFDKSDPRLTELFPEVHEPEGTPPLKLA
jgi:hypothetical protein